MHDDDVMAAIDEYTARHGFPPTQREIAALCDVSDRAVRKRLAKLNEAGEVTWEQGKRRTIRRTDMKGRSIPMS